MGFKAFELRKDEFPVVFFFLIFNFITPEGFTALIGAHFGELRSIFFCPFLNGSWIPRQALQCGFQSPTMYVLYEAVMCVYT